MNKKTKGKKRKICVLTGTRAEYGLLKPVMEEIQKHPKLELMIIATGMHLLKEFGSTYKELEKDGFTITKKIDIAARQDDSLSMATSVGRAVVKFAEAFTHIKPDILLINGDRAEVLAAAISAAFMNIQIAHMHGGDRSKGTLDESVRHAITKLAHIHFAATQTSAERIRKMGEEDKRIFVVGAPGLDSILHEKKYSRKELSHMLKMDFFKPTLLVIQHPLTIEPENAATQIQETLEAIKTVKIQAIVVYPNIDAGGRSMISVIRKYEHLQYIHAFKNLDHKIYVSLLQHVSVIVGNSSSGIIETPLFRLPVVNIGMRQHGRERSTNVIDVPHEKNAIISAIKKALSPGFRNSIQHCSNPYGNGTAGKKIAGILSKITIDKDLLRKELTY